MAAFLGPVPQQHSRGNSDDRSRWLMNIATLWHPDIAAVAHTNKTVRIALAIPTREQGYREQRYRAA